jgi:hypothetical protein
MPFSDNYILKILSSDKCLLPYDVLCQVLIETDLVISLVADQNLIRKAHLSSTLENTRAFGSGEAIHIHLNEQISPLV